MQCEALRTASTRQSVGSRLGAVDLCSALTTTCCAGVTQRSGPGHTRLHTGDLLCGMDKQLFCCRWQVVRGAGFQGTLEAGCWGRQAAGRKMAHGYVWCECAFLQEAGHCTYAGLGKAVGWERGPEAALRGVGRSTGHGCGGLMCMTGCEASEWGAANISMLWCDGHRATRTRGVCCLLLKLPHGSCFFARVHQPTGCPGASVLCQKMWLTPAPGLAAHPPQAATAAAWMCRVCAGPLR